MTTDPGTSQIPPSPRPSLLRSIWPWVLLLFAAVIAAWLLTYQISTRNAPEKVVPDEVIPRQVSTE